VAPPDPPTNLVASDHPSGSDAGYDGAIHVDFTVPAANSSGLSYVQYGIDGTTESSEWGSLPGAGSTADESITGLTNGNTYTVYVSACNDAGLCSPWVGPSNQVIPYGPPGPPSVTAHANGTSITYTWGGGGGNGRAVSSYYVCFDGGSCSTTGAGSTTKTYGYSQTHTITAYVTDAAGQQSSTASASATTQGAPAMSVSVAQGPGRTVSGCGTTPPCYDVIINVSNAPANTVLHYACFDTSDSPPQFWPPSGTVDTGWSGSVESSNGSGAASFQSQCVFGWWGKQHLQVSVNGTYSP
jgi:hypothetical protein